jgi:hypothetical protein
MKTKFTLLSLIALFFAINLQADPVTIRVKPTGIIGDIYLYGHGDATPFGGWPGALMTPDGDGFVTATFENTGQNTIYAIFHDNNDTYRNETGINVAHGGCWEALGWNNFTAIACEPAEELLVTIKFKAPDEWGPVSVYTYNPELEGGWNGKPLTKDEMGLYPYTFDFNLTSGSINLIFNDGSTQAEFFINTAADACYDVNGPIICPANPNSIDDLLNETLIVYPNPTSDYIYFSSPDEITNIVVYDAGGKQLKSVESPKDGVSLSGYNSGLYIISFINADGMKVNKSIIKR